jgi:hypothetical protein
MITLNRTRDLIRSKAAPLLMAYDVYLSTVHELPGSTLYDAREGKK